MNAKSEIPSILTPSSRPVRIPIVELILFKQTKQRRNSLSTYNRPGSIEYQR